MLTLVVYMRNSWDTLWVRVQVQVRVLVLVLGADLQAGRALVLWQSVHMCW